MYPKAMRDNVCDERDPIPHIFLPQMTAKTLTCMQHTAQVNTTRYDLQSTSQAD